MNTIKHYFPGGNTSRGFVNYFDGIVAPWVENKRVYVLKGGPGVGKNTFMNAFSSTLVEKGYCVEHFHCASDVKSLDAVHIPKLGVTMLDGTAPHVIDPVVPGAIDGILNLGVYLDEKGLSHRKNKIKQLNEENSRGYRRTYAYLGAAGKLQEHTDYLYLCALDQEELRDEVQDLFGSHELKLGRYKGTVRRLFAEALTPQGFQDFFHTVVSEEKIIVLNGPTIIATEYMKMAINFARFMGYGCEVYYSSLLPDNPIHVIIKDLGICLTTNIAFDQTVEKVIDLTYLLDAERVAKCDSILEFNQLYTKQLLEASVESLAQTKEVHDEIEEIYRDYIDFGQVSSFTEKFIDEFLNDIQKGEI